MTVRIGTGLASGTDNTAIINSILTAKQVPVTRLKDDIEDDELLLTKWGEVDTLVSALEDSTSELSSYTVWNQKSAESSDETVMTATAATGAVPGSYSIVATTLATADQYHSKSVTSATTALNLEGSFTINGQTITVDTSDSITDIMNSVNSVSGDMTNSVRAYIVDKTLFFKSSDTGTDYVMDIEDVSGGILSSLEMKSNYTAATNFSGTVEGIGVTSQSNTGITSFISGVTLNFVDTGSCTLEVANDTETIKSLLETFVENYNNLNSYMSTAQSVTVTDDTIDTVGYLQGDLLANSLQTRIRRLLSVEITNSDYINSDYNSLRKIGIYVESDTSQLAIGDEDTLDTALENNFDDIKNLFRMTDPTTGESVGIMKNLDSYLYTLTDPVEGSISVRKTNIQAGIDDKEERITDLNDNLAAYETLLYEHFSASESFQADLTSQLSYLQSTLGS